METLSCHLSIEHRFWTSAKMYKNQPAAADLKRSVVNAHILLSAAQAHGISPEQVLEGCSISRQELRSQTDLIAARDELQMIRNVLLKRPVASGIGLEVGAKYHLAAFGVWGFALANSATVGEAVKLSLAHSAMTFAFCQLSVEEHGSQVHWYFDDVGMSADLKIFSVEREMVALGMVAHDLLGANFEAIEIWFNYAEPSHSALYRKYFNGPLRFSAPRSGFVLPRTLFEQPLKVPDDVLKAAGTSGLRSENASISERVRNVILTNIQSLPTMEAVADELCMNIRTLRRKLEGEGLTFRQLVDEVRFEQAKELLERTSMTTDDIAAHLSYADASSFTQAFRRLAGTSPAAYRRTKNQPSD